MIPQTPNLFGADVKSSQKRKTKGSEKIANVK